MSKAINNAMAVALHTVKSYNSSPKGDGKRRARRASRRAGKALANDAS